MNYAMTVANGGNQEMPGQDTMPGYARGGRTGGNDSHFDWAHFNKNELPTLDDLQGGATFIPGTKIRNYKRLEKSLSSNPQFRQGVDSHLQHLARGGQIHSIREQGDNIRRSGRHGDTEAAIIGPHTRAMLNHYLGGGSINPHTGKCEYWGLSDMLSGLKGLGDNVYNGMKSVGNFMAPMEPILKPLANAAGTMFDIPNAGDMIENGYHGAMNLGDQLGLGKNQPDPNSFMGKATGALNKGAEFMNSPMGQNLVGAGANALNAKQGGANMANSFMSGANNFASKYNNPASRFVQGASQGYMGNNPAQGGGGSANWQKNVARGVANSARGVANPIANSIGSAANKFAQSGNMGQSAQAGAKQMMGYNPQNLGYGDEQQGYA